MKLKEASVNGLFKAYDCSIAVNEKNLTFVHSLNGTGKSTMLRLINAIFTGDTKLLESIPFKEVVLDFYDGSQLVAENKGKLKYRMKMKDVEDELEPSEVRKLIGINYLSAERTTVETDRGLLPALNTYIDEFNSEYAKRIGNLKLGKPKKIVKKDESDFIPWCLDLKAKLDFMADAGLILNFPPDVKFPPSRFDYSSNKEKYDETVSAASEWVEENHAFAESVIIYLDIVNKFFHNKEIFIDAKNTFQIKTTNGVPIPIDSLSAGEKQILIMFYRILFQSKQGSLVFIDEPEISLHVSWQQKLGNVLSDISRVRDLQIVIATHSPQVIHDMWDFANEMRLKRA